MGTEVADVKFLEVGIVLGQVVEVVGLKGHAQAFGKAVYPVGATRVSQQQQPAALLHKVQHQVAFSNPVGEDGRNYQEGVGAPQPLSQGVSAGFAEELDVVAPVGYPGQQGGDFPGGKGVAMAGIHQQRAPVGGADGVGGKHGLVGKVLGRRRDGQNFFKVNFRRFRRSVATPVEELVGG